jgi:hypothetical protein
MQRQEAAFEDVLFPMHFRFTLSCLLSAAALAGAADYSRDIQPLFAEHCLECHGPDDSKGGLVLTSREAALKELKSGAKGIVPGDVAASSLIERVTTHRPRRSDAAEGQEATQGLRGRAAESLDQRRREV